MTIEIQHLTSVPVVIPARATAFAAKAEKHGWRVVITTTHGPAKTPDGTDVHVVTLEQQSVEQGGGRKQVVGPVKMIDVVAVRCSRGLATPGRDLLVAIWEDGSFDSACRPWALRMLSSHAASTYLETKEHQTA